MALRVVSFPASRQQNEERGYFGGCKPFTVDFGLYQAGGQILTGTPAAVVGQRDGVGTHIHRHRDELVEIGRDVGVSEPQDHIRPVEDILMVFLGDAHHVADDLQRQRTGQFGDDVARAVRMVGDHRRDQLMGALTNRVLGAGHHPWRKRAAHDIA